MKDLVRINTETQEPIVDGRELHEILGVESNYTTWFNRMCEYGFVEEIDYTTYFPNLESEKHGGQNKINHAIKLDMAKEIAMIQRTERGKRVRKYFIQVEKDFNSPEKVMARALKFAEQRLNVLQLENSQQKQLIEEQKPKVLFAESVETSEDTILINELSKILKQNGCDIGQNRLFERLRDEGYLIRKNGKSWNLPTQKAMDLGLFEIKKTVITKPNGDVLVRATPVVTGKGQIYFVKKFLKEAS